MLQQSVTKCTSREIAELLESDDELPDFYDEVPEIPAYQNDNRFARLEPIQFEWLHEKFRDINIQAKLSKQPGSAQAEPVSSEILSQQHASANSSCKLTKTFPKPTDNTIKNRKNKILISRGVLSKRDRFFIESILQYSTDTTLLWFIDFLTYKSVQPLQRSCLVGDVLVDQCDTANKPFFDFNMRYYFKLVVN